MRLKYLLVLLVFGMILMSVASAASSDDMDFSTVSFDYFEMDLPYGSYFNETWDEEDVNLSIPFKVYENQGLYSEEINALVFFDRTNMSKSDMTI